MRYTLVILFVLLISGCQDIVEIEKPKNLIPQDRMEEIMYEALLLKSARGYNIGSVTSKGINPETFVLDKFDLDSTQYAQNVAYYAAQTEQYREMNSRINERVLAFLKIEDSLNTIERKIKDSLRLKRVRENEEARMALRKKDSLFKITGDSTLITPDVSRPRFETTTDSL